MTRSTWARRCGVAAAVAAVALVAAACSSQPSASRSTKAQAKAHEVTFPAPYGTGTPYSYGPSWARFVAAFPIWKQPVHYTGQEGRDGRWYVEVPCTQAQAEPSYDATNGHGYNGTTGTPPPPSFVVRIYKCPSVARAAAFLRLGGPGGVHVSIDGHPALQWTGTAARPGRASFVWEWRAFRVGRIVWVITGDAVNRAVAEDFVDSFSLHTAGYQPAPSD